MPGPYTFTPGRDIDFTLDGKQYVLKRNEPITIPYTDPCDVKRFVIAANTKTGLNLTSISANSWKQLLAICPDGSGTGTGTSPKDVPPPKADPPPEVPALTGSDQTPPAETGETPQTLGAPVKPDGGDRVDAESPGPGESDGRTPAEQYYDARRPLPNYDLPPILLSQGTDPNQLESALQRIMRNDPPAGFPHPDFSGNNREQPITVHDPVVPFTGQYVSSTTDIAIPSRGFPLRLERVYASGPVYYGPWGYNWDHNYNMHIRELVDGGVALWTGRLSEQVYKLMPDGSFAPPIGVFRKLEWQPSTPLTPDRYVLTELSGMKHIFSRPSGWPLPDRIPLERIEDAHGNAHTLSYDTEGRVGKVGDPAGRYLQFAYGGCGLLEHVRDHTGREWHYDHDDEIEHLVAVRIPPTADNPQGRSARYDYDRFRTHPALQHNLTRVIDAEDRVVVENTYGGDPGTDDFGRVVFQRFGDFAASFSATVMQYVPRTPDAVNVPAIRVEMEDTEKYTVSTFNHRGDILDERFRLVKDGSYRLWVRVYRYDDQGNMIEERFPDGLAVHRTFDAGNPDPRARENLLKAELTSPPDKPSPSRQVVRFTYEPRYHRVKTVTDEAGAVTTFVYDYEETLADAGDVIRIEYPDALLPDGSTQTGSETFRYNAFGQIIEQTTGEGYIHRFEYAPAGPFEGYLSGTAFLDGTPDTVHTQYEYDVWGNRSAVIDGLGNRTAYENNAIGLVTAVRLPDTGSGTDILRSYYSPSGFLSRQELPRGNYSDGKIADPFIMHEFGHDALGRLIEVRYGVNTSSPANWSYSYDIEGNLCREIDPIGRETTSCYDERGLLLENTIAAGTADSVTRRYVYDRNGNRSAAIDPVGRRTDFRYDSWGRMFESKRPGSPDSERTAVRFQYGVCDRIVRDTVIGVSHSGGAAAVLFEGQTQYDARGRAWLRNRQGLEWKSWFDRDNLLSRQTDPRGGTSLYGYDALGRLRSVTDPLGSVERHLFDAAGRLVNLEEEETAPGEPALKYRTEFRYDARGNITKTIDSLGNTSRTEYDGRGMPVAQINALGHRTAESYRWDGLRTERKADAGPGGIISERWSYDAAGRLAAYTDPEGNRTDYAFNGRDQPASTVYPDGSKRSWFYGSGGLLSEQRSPAGNRFFYTYAPNGAVSQVQAAAAPGFASSPGITYDYDGLMRIVKLSQGTRTVERSFDWQGRVTHERSGTDPTSVVYDDAAGRFTVTFPDGRADTVQTDLLGRISTVARTAAGVGAFAQLPAAGTTLAAYEYAGANRIHRRTLGNGTVTHYGYDGARRLAAIDHRTPGGVSLASFHYVYDGAGRPKVAHAVPAPLSADVYDYDPVNRLVSVLEGVSVAPPSPVSGTQADQDAYAASTAGSTAASSQRYTLDRADRRIKHDNNSGTVSAVHATPVNSRGAIVSKTDTTAGPIPSFHSFSFDADGNCLQDDRFAYKYDAFGQIVEARDLVTSTVVLQQEYDPLGRIALRSFGAASETYAHFMAQLTQISDGTGAPLLAFGYGARTDEPIVTTAAGGGSVRALWGHSEARGCLIAATDDNGIPLERYRYDVFGSPQIWSGDGNALLPHSGYGMRPIYAGHAWIGAVGLYDARARLYDPRLGRFLQSDPAGYLDSANPYVYAGHNPALFIDPTGQWVHIAIGAAVGAVIGGVVAYRANPNADFLDVMEGALVGAGVGALSAATFGAAAGALTAAGYGVVTTGALAGAASGAVGGGVSGGYWGGRQSYTQSGGDLNATVSGAGYGTLRGGVTGAIGGAVGGAVAGGIWGQAVTRGALPAGAAAVIRRGGAAPYAWFSPQSAAGVTSIGSFSGATGSIADTAAQDLWSVSFEDGRTHNFGEYMEAGMYGAGGGAATAYGMRYVNGSPWSRYADDYNFARTQEGMSNAKRADANARKTYGRKNDLPKGWNAHHQRSVQGYPELAGRLEQLIPKSRSEHSAEHGRWGNSPNPFNNVTHGPWTPAYPGSYFHYHDKVK